MNRRNFAIFTMSPLALAACGGGTENSTEATGEAPQSVSIKSPEAAPIVTQAKTEISQLYVGLFGRAPDLEGYNFWIGQRQVKTMVEIANMMYGTTAARPYYPSNYTNEQIITSFYVNVLGRQPDSGGLAFWVGKLNEPGATVGSVVVQMIVAVVNYNGSDPAGLTSKALFINKVDVARFYAEHHGDIARAHILGGVTSVRSTVVATQQTILNYGFIVINWFDAGAMYGITTNYTPLVILNGNDVKVFSNSTNADPNTTGQLNVFDGTLSGVGPSRLVLQTPPGADAFIRTAAVSRGASGKYYALLFTGDAYPGTNGYSPSFANSNDGETWTWHGPISPYARSMASSAAMVVDESRNDMFRFIAWVDNVNGSSMRMMQSSNGLTWVDGGVMWPEVLAGDVDPLFATACRTPYGVHLITAKDWPATKHRHLFSVDGVSNWKVLEQSCSTFQSGVQKGTNLCYNAADNTVYALTAGKLRCFTARAF